MGFSMLKKNHPAIYWGTSMALETPLNGPYFPDFPVDQHSYGKNEPFTDEYHLKMVIFP